MTSSVAFEFVKHWFYFDLPICVLAQPSWHNLLFTGETGALTKYNKIEMVWKDVTRYDKVWQGMKRCKKSWQDMTEHDRVSQGVTRCDKVWQGVTRCNKARPPDEQRECGGLRLCPPTSAAHFSLVRPSALICQPPQDIGCGFINQGHRSENKRWRTYRLI